MSAYEMLERVTDRDSFVKFLKALSQDSVENPEEWENRTISEYLESISAWIEDTHTGEGGIKHLEFKEMAEVFYVGKIYE